MPTSVIEHIRRTMLPRDGAGRGDGELLGRFIERRDEAALAALVNRHGPMVWGVCRRLLGHHDAEDAFQATFIVLVRKAASIAHGETVGNWLYGVAHRAASQARRAARRRAKEVQVTEMPDPEDARQDRWPDLQPLLDQELSRLPDHYRAVVVLSDLEGKTRKEVAALLGCPEGTVASRLARARSMLAKRLTKRGVALSGGALAAALSRDVASAGVPASVVVSTIKAANLFAAGRAAVSTEVAALAEGVLKTMLLTRLKCVMAVLVVAAMVGLIGFGVAWGQQKGVAVGPRVQGSEPKAQKVEDAVVREEADKEEAIAWGKEVDGLQAGLAADASTLRQGDTIKLTVKLRNVGKAEVAVAYSVLRDYAPRITTDSEGRVSVYMPPPFDNYPVPIKRALKPGETITLYNPEVAVESEARARLEGWMRVDTPTICVEPGKYKVTFGGMIRSHPKLATGAVDFEVKPAKDESFTAWGKEIGGLQAGLSLAEKRAYRHGETVTLALRVRNVGKEAVEFKHIWAFFVENAPAITDADGKTVALPKVLAEGEHIPRKPSIAPGKEVELYEWKISLHPKGEESKTLFAIHGTGKFSLQCERVVGPTSANHNHPNPALDKLATGKLELEIKEEAPPGRTGGLSGSLAPMPAREQARGREAPPGARPVAHAAGGAMPPCEPRPAFGPRRETPRENSGDSMATVRACGCSPA